MTGAVARNGAGDLPQAWLGCLSGYDLATPTVLCLAAAACLLRCAVCSFSFSIPEILWRSSSTFLISGRSSGSWCQHCCTKT